MEKKFIKDYYGKIPNTDILLQLNAMRKEPLNMSTLRHQMRRMRLITGVRLVHWTPEQTQFLLDNYLQIGNIELAKKLNKLKLSKRKFKKKHIEKKMILLGIKRTEESLLHIKENHKAAGHYPGRVHGIPEGDIVVRAVNGMPHHHIKIGKILVKYARILYKEKVGPIPAGYMVHFKDLDTLNLSLSNLYLKKIGDLTFADKSKMYQIAAKNMERLNAKPKAVEEISRPAIAKPEQTIKVVINPRLTLHVKPGTDIDSLRAKYNRPIQQIINSSYA